MPRTKLEFFSEEQIALMKEIKNHPKLLNDIVNARLESDDWGGLLGEVGAYCGVILEGDYLPLELNKLCTILIFKLQAIGMRNIIG